MKGLAFAYDPDGYWIELVPRDKGATHPEQYNLGQTMLRVKDVEKTLKFYTGQGGLGMTKASECVKLVTTKLSTSYVLYSARQTDAVWYLCLATRNLLCTGNL